MVLASMTPFNRLAFGESNTLTTLSDGKLSKKHFGANKSISKSDVGDTRRRSKVSAKERPET
jgi:hypothetical protein